MKETVTSFSDTNLSEVSQLDTKKVILCTFRKKLEKWQGGWNWMICEIHSNPSHSMILCW